MGAGLELFLLIDNPCAGLLHDRSSERRAFHRLSGSFRAADEPRSAREWIADLPPEAIALTTLPSIDARIFASEIATMTRAAPAEAARPDRSRPSRRGRRRRRRGLRRQDDIAPMFPPRASRVQGRRTCRARRQRQPLPLGPRADRAARARSSDRSPHAGLLRGSLMASRRTCSKCPSRRIGRPDPFELVPCAS